MPPHQYGLNYDNTIMMTMMADNNNEYSSTHSVTNGTTTTTLTETKMKYVQQQQTTTIENGRSHYTIQKKRTRFALSNNEVFLIPHINDMSDEEVIDIWYEKHDYDQIKGDIVPIVKKMMKGDKIEETNEMTIRGLEYRTRKGAIKRQHNKVEAITAVLDEQDRQIENDMNNPELISIAYLEISQPCLYESHKLACNDEIIARELHNESQGYESDATEASTASKRKGGVRKTTSGIGKMFKTMRIRSKAAAMSPAPSRSNSPKNLRDP